jgi:hypothetical protein
VKRAVITDNIMSGPLQVTNQAKAKVVIANNSATESNSGDQK